MSTNYPYSADSFTAHTDQGVDVTGEQHIIPSVSPYIVTLNDIPLGPITNSDGSVTPTTLVIVGWTEITDGAPQAGQYIVNYTTGILTFNLMDSGRTIQASYTTAGDTILAEHVNTLQDGMDGVQDDLLGSHRALKAVINSGGSSIDIFGGSYGRDGEYRTFTEVLDQSHVDWAVAGTYYVYIDNTDTLVLNGGSFPNDGIPICTVATATSGVISTLTDSRVQVGSSGSTGGITIIPVHFFFPGVMSLAGGPYGDGFYVKTSLFSTFVGSQSGIISGYWIGAVTPPTGANLLINVNTVGGGEFDATLPIGVAELGFAASLAVGASSVVQIKVKQIGSTVAGGDVTLNLMFQPD